MANLKASLFLVAALLAVSAVPAAVAKRALLASSPKSHKLKLGVILDYDPSTPVDEAYRNDALAFRNIEYFAANDFAFRGVKIEYVVNNSGCDLDRINATVESMIEQGVQAIVGSLCSSDLLLVSPILTEYKIPLVASASGAVQLASNTPYVFRTLPPPTVLVPQLMANLYKHGVKKIAYLYDNSVLSVGITELAQKSFNGTTSYSVVFAAGAGDGVEVTNDAVVSLAQQAIASNPDAYWLHPSSSANGTLIYSVLKTIKDANASALVILNNGIPTSALALDETAQGTYPLLAGALTQSVPSNNQTWNDRFTEQFSYTTLFPELYNGDATIQTNEYAAIGALIKAVAESSKKEPTGEEIAAVLSSEGFTFPLFGGGVATFNSDGDLEIDTYTVKFDLAGDLVEAPEWN